MPTMKAIETPKWAWPIELKVDPRICKDERRSLISGKGAVLSLATKAVQQYVEDPLLTFDSHEIGFPCLNRLTGEFYIARVAVGISIEPESDNLLMRRELHISVMCHCLESALNDGQKNSDYLGLEVHLSFDPALKQFAHNGDVDSSSI